MLADFARSLKSHSDVSPLNYTTILGRECTGIVYIGRMLSWLITAPLDMYVK